MVQTNNGWPRWTPRTTLLLGLLTGPRSHSFRTATANEIYLINTDGTGLVNLTNDAAGDTGPAWSPSGGKIAFSSDRDGNWKYM